MSSTWLLRGIAVAVFGVLVGAWGVGFADLDSSPSTDKPPAPASPDDQPTLDGTRWVVHPDAKKPRRTREAEVAAAVLTEGPPDAEPSDPSTSPTPSADPDPSFSPDPSPTPDPSNPPTNPPSQPPEECAEPTSVVDCALDPVTEDP